MGKNPLIQISIDESSTINLNADFFHTVSVEQQGEHDILISVPDNPLSKLFRRKMRCFAVFSSRNRVQGVIENIRCENGTYRIRCLFPEYSLSTGV